MSGLARLRIDFVCTGNICRSPMGDVVFRALAGRAGMADRFEVGSRGTHGYHVGDGADPRTIAALATAGFDGRAHRAARLERSDIERSDLLIAMDRGHRRIMLEMGAPAERVALMTAYDPERPEDPDVFDPYYSDARAFDRVLAQVERSCAVLLDELCDSRLE